MGKLTIEEIQAHITATHFVNAADAVESTGTWSRLPNAVTSDGTSERKELARMTLCFLVLKNGYVALGKSACTDLNEFDQVRGESAAYQDALREVRAVLSYRRLNEREAIEAN